MKSPRLSWIAVLVLIVAAHARADDDPWRFSLGGGYEYGRVNGYVQTPAGGEPNTTSDKRPKLDEIGIDNTSVYDATFMATRGENALYLGGQWIRMSGSGTLDQTLITQGETFPAGSHVSSNVNLDWYRFGYQRRFALGSSGEWTISPSVGAAVLDFDYKLRDVGTSVSRSYAKVNAQFGVDIEWRPGGGRFSVDLELLGCPPITPPLPQMNVERVVAKYELVDSGKYQLELLGGLGFEQIYFEDHQSVSNRIKADLGPLVIFGVNLRF